MITIAQAWNNLTGCSPQYWLTRSWLAQSWLAQCCGRTIRLWIASLAAWPAFACGGYTATVRIIDGEVVKGRAISSEAYADYLRGAYLESLGRDEAALAAYEAALDQDDDSAEIQTRIAEIHCRQGSNEADNEFSNAVSSDDTYEPAWRAWALCALSRNQTAQAVHFAQLGQQAAPNEFQATRTLANALLADGQALEARQQLAGFLARYPNHIGAWQEMAALAASQADASWTHAARRALAQLPNERAAWVPSRASRSSATGARLVRSGAAKSDPTQFCAATSSSAQTRPESNAAESGRTESAPIPTLPADETATQRGAIVQELCDGDLRKARELAVVYRVSPAELSQLALRHGLHELALNQARFVLSADPENSNVRIIGLLAADRLEDHKAFRALVRPGRAALSAPDRVNAEHFARILQSRAGNAAAAAWRRAVGAAREASPETSQ